MNPRVCSESFEPRTPQTPPKTCSALPSSHPRFISRSVAPSTTYHYAPSVPCIGFVEIFGELNESGFPEDRDPRHSSHGSGSSGNIFHIVPLFVAGIAALPSHDPFASHCFRQAESGSCTSSRTMHAGNVRARIKRNFSMETSNAPTPQTRLSGMLGALRESSAMVCAQTFYGGEHLEV